jgi:hypothetical protein
MLREVQCTLECIQQNKKVPIHEWELRLKMTRSSISIQVGAIEYSSVLTIVGAVSRWSIPTASQPALSASLLFTYWVTAPYNVLRVRLDAQAFSWALGHA